MSTASSTTQPDPSADLRERVMRAYRRRRGTAVAAPLLCGALLAILAGIMPATEEAQADVPYAGRQPATDPVGDVTALDHALQVAYARGASEDETAPMWRERERLLHLLQSRAS